MWWQPCTQRREMQCFTSKRLIFVAHILLHVRKLKISLLWKLIFSTYSRAKILGINFNLWAFLRLCSMKMRTRENGTFSRLWYILVQWCMLWATTGREVVGDVNEMRLTRIQLISRVMWMRCDWPESSWSRYPKAIFLPFASSKAAKNRSHIPQKEKELIPTKEGHILPANQMSFSRVN
jgi:hypothetical protein